MLFNSYSLVTNPPEQEPRFQVWQSHCTDIFSTLKQRRFQLGILRNQRFAFHHFLPKE
ncbi:MAG: hypothetical protein V7K35_13645 [Nostoc sp.]|uniref:hypothetical protein n=1 Tax=Nostoc sp. TaxID=1180 RepID=UPI002FFACA5A